MLRLNKKFFSIIILAVFLLFVVSFAPARNVVVSFFVSAGRPFLKLNSRDNEVSALKNKVAELEAKILICGSPLPITATEQYFLSSVISRPPQSPYDIIVVDSGSDSGIKLGAKAIFSSDVLLGYVAEVFSRTSKIKLVSFPGEETNVMIEPVQGGVKISTLAIGRGGGNMEIKIPSAIEIYSGDLIKTPGTRSFLLGTVGKIQTNLSDPFQQILFRLPVNLQELDKVMIEK